MQKISHKDFQKWLKTQVPFCPEQNSVVMAQMGALYAGAMMIWPMVNELVQALESCEAHGHRSAISALDRLRIKIEDGEAYD